MKLTVRVGDAFNVLSCLLVFDMKPHVRLGNQE